MRQFYKLIPYDAKQELQFVAKYDLGDFDHTMLWKSHHVPESLLQRVKLFLTMGEAADYVANPLSWPICSSRLVAAASTTIEKDCQILAAPLVDQETWKRVGGFHVLNVMRQVACLDLERSDISYDEEHANHIFMVYDIVLDKSKIDENVHVFRLFEWPYAVIVSDVFANKLVGRQFHGLGLQSCNRRGRLH